MYTFDEQIVSDLHKDAYGCRPSQFWWQCWKEADNDEKQREWDDLLEQLDRTIELERQEEMYALKSFNGWVDVTRMHAGSEEDALRWITQDQGFAHCQDIEHWVWSQGILFTDRGREVVATLKRIWLVEG
jgi:hypothetical protein